MRKNLRRIKIGIKDKVKGFYELITSDSSIVCLPDNEYIIPESILERLREKKIKFSKLV